MASKLSSITTPDEMRHSTNNRDWSSDDDSTEKAGSNRGKNDEVEREICVKWQLPGTSDMSTAKKDLYELLVNLLTEYPNQIILIDRKQREWTFQESDDEKKFVEEFNKKSSIQIHAIKNKQKQPVRWISVIKFRTLVTIQEWKNNDNVYSIIQEKGAYVFPHPFGVDEWNIVSIGFLKNIHVIHYPKEEIQSKIHQLIEEDNPSLDIPAFQLIPQRITTSDKKASTKAYVIQCTSDDAKSLATLLTKGAFRKQSNQLFVPFRYKRSNPEIFLQCIRQQNDIYYKTWVIKMEGFTRGAIESIQPELKAIQGVHQVVPTKRTEEIGEWKIMVDQSKCSFIHRKLTTNWNNILARIPKEILNDAPLSFPTPTISSKKIHEYQETDSDADSYGSLLTIGTEGSQMTTEEFSLNELPVEYQFPTYAAAARSSTMSSETTQVSSPTTSTFSDWQREKQELESQIRQQASQIEQIQADLQDKITRSHDLEERLARALDLAHTRDLRHEEMMIKLELLMERHTQVLPPEDTTNPSTPARPPKPVTSPPPKRPNTNPSPNRDVYAMFRQTTGKQAFSRHITTYQPTTSESQQAMDTDDDIMPPPPGVKSGRKLE